MSSPRTRIGEQCPLPATWEKPRWQRRPSTANKPTTRQTKGQMRLCFRDVLFSGEDADRWRQVRCTGVSTSRTSPSCGLGSRQRGNHLRGGGTLGSAWREGSQPCGVTVIAGPGFWGFEDKKKTRNLRSRFLPLISSTSWPHNRGGPSPPLPSRSHRQELRFSLWFFTQGSAHTEDKISPCWSIPWLTPPSWFTGNNNK